ncbi:hypothetical protein GO491_05555 [Flavobacteriaceae bacterium Ap0902]|nr:hypothetical protein [Flavobacteriaceae bacterium Ap0902]
MLTYQEVFAKFWEQVEESVEVGDFAKLTMAKTIGKPDLHNVFVRPANLEDEPKFLVKLHYRSRQVDDEEEEYTLNQTLEVIKQHLKNPFWTVLLFTTAKDVTFKINKKDVATITEKAPTFSEVRLADKD